MQQHRYLRIWINFMILGLAFVGTPSVASTAGHSDPAAPVVLALAVILVAAKLGGEIATRLKQPPVLGELFVGVALSSLSLVGVSWFDAMRTDVFLDMFSRVGVIVLLFEVGLESTVAQMMKTGLSALLVACLGVATPFASGWVVGVWLLPTHSAYVHAFLGATLTATSVGITARVLKDLNRSTTPESRIILGAAVIDDVLGLVILAVVSGIIEAADAGGELAMSDIALTIGKAVGFLVGALALGLWLSPRLFTLASKLRVRMVLLAVGLSFCFVLAWLADVIGLAPIVGAFAAGLILEDVHYEKLASRDKETMEQLIHPISNFLVPVFFVLMGLRTDLKAFAEPGVLWLAAALCVVAVAGKLVAGLGALGTGLDRLSIGFGMMPRGEVGLIFASIGATLHVKGEPVVDPAVFSAVVVMVIVTTMVTPPLLTWSLARQTLKASAPTRDRDSLHHRRQASSSRRPRSK
jgi:Kef-type K+ transport system membrane component KefB